MNKKIMFAENEVTLKNHDLQIGDQAPMFKAITKELTLFESKDYLSKVIIVTSFPSIDTSVAQNRYGSLTIKQHN